MYRVWISRFVAVSFVQVCALWFTTVKVHAADNDWRPSYPNSFAVSVDEKQVVFSSPKTHGDLWAFELGNHKYIPLTDERVFHGWPSFSPDGRRLVFSKRLADGHRVNLFASDAKARNVHPLTEGEFYDLGGAFSPDGARVVFFRAHSRRTYSLGGETWDDWDLYTVSVTGNDLRRLTTEHFYSVDPPRFTVSGTIVFAAMSNDRGARMSLYEFIQNRNPQLTTFEAPGKDSGRTFTYSQPAVCPGTGEVVFISNRVSRVAPFDYELWELSLNEMKSNQLTHLQALIQYPICNWTGSRIYFLADADRKGTYDLYVCDRDGSDIKRVQAGLCSQPRE